MGALGHPRAAREQRDSIWRIEVQSAKGGRTGEGALSGGVAAVVSRKLGAKICSKVRQTSKKPLKYSPKKKLAAGQRSRREWC